MKDKPSILFLQETKCSIEDLAKLFTIICKGSQSMAIDAKGALGGIAIIWNPMQVSLSHFASTTHYLSVIFHILGTTIKVHLLNTYGPQTPILETHFIHYLDWFVHSHSDSPIIIRGYFNMILMLEEKKGGMRSLSKADQDFKDLVSNNGLIDLLPASRFFTWNNKRGSTHHIAKHLDRFLISNNTLSLGGILSFVILPTARSYH